MRMKPMMFLCMFALAACQSERKPNQTLAVQTGAIPKDTVQSERKDPITIENLPGINAPVIMDGDTVYTDVDTPPVFSAGDLEDYLQEAVKDIHIGEAIPVVMFVVSKAGYPCHVAIRRSANVFISDIQTAQKIDSIACKLVQDLPRFTPASLDGELVNHRMVVAVRFK